MKIKFKLYRDGVHVGFEEHKLNKKQNKIMLHYFNPSGVEVVGAPQYNKKEPFTGLHDKDGNEIYCGDILAYDDYLFPWLVVWHKDFCQFGMRMPDYSDSSAMGGMNTCIGEIYKIIGNIHENPELLEKQDDR